MIESLNRTLRENERKGGCMIEGPRNVCLPQPPKVLTARKGFKLSRRMKAGRTIASSRSNRAARMRLVQEQAPWESSKFERDAGDEKKGERTRGSLIETPGSATHSP